jgi:hypothetical protein
MAISLAHSLGISKYDNFIALKTHTVLLFMKR